MSALALSVVLSFVSAVAYAGGAIIQERVAVTSPGQTYAPLRRPGWWAAVALTGLGGLLHVVALAFGPLSLVQPLGALTIVFALPMAALFVGRRAGAAAWRGAIMATVGLAGLLSLVGASDAQSLSNAQRVALGVVSGGAVAALMVAGRAAHRHPAVRSVVLAVAAGIAFSMSSVFTKTVAVDWSQHVSLADLSSLAAIGAFATAGMLISQASYRGAGLEAPLATLTVVNPVVAAAVGITMFGETFRYGTAGTVLALGCGVVAAGGLILLTIERIGSGERTAPSVSEVAALAEPTAVMEPPAVPEPTAVMEPVTVPPPVVVTQPVAAGVPEADAGQRADAPHAPTSVPAPVALTAASGPRLPGPAVSRPRLAEPAVPAVADLGALTPAEAAVAELLAGLPEPTDPPEGADGFVPAAQPGAGRRPGPGSVAHAHTARAGAGSVPQAAGAGGDGVFPPALRPAGASALVPAPVKAAVPTMEVVAAGHPEARDELPYLTVLLGVPYVPIPFVSHHRTRVRS
ncbi:DMT family transporter [Streptomyces sp. NBC_00659]|uniref:DMT family transporter n=1 Tax=Streptomyces sp. NBC_00659 TaxID=2903669 RepID=UPI002E379439|nr:DMT family transporter [Streptomyces sp. NBC_00659]